ncbi:ATP-dependent RNA helicase, DEAD/DEAH box family, partial [Streptococcus agalactiae H36B]
MKPATASEAFQAKKKVALKRIWHVDFLRGSGN